MNNRKICTVTGQEFDEDCECCKLKVKNDNISKVSKAILGFFRKQYAGDVSSNFLAYTETSDYRGLDIQTKAYLSLTLGTIDNMMAVQIYQLMIKHEDNLSDSELWNMMSTIF
tara:strand:- start:895 stop:1233 length:339 start_codon:yes stop_codon:yes gene_type:complete